MGLCTSCLDEFDRKRGGSHPLTGAVIMAKACYNPEEAVAV